MSLRKLGSQTLSYGLSNILGRLLNYFLITAFITRLFSSEEFGVVGDLMFWTAWAIAILVFRMDTAVFRFASRREYDRESVLRRTQGLVLGLSVTVLGSALLLAERIADWLDYPDRVVYVQLVVLTVLFDVLAAVPLARLRLDERVGFFVAVNLGNVAVNIGSIFLLLWIWPARGTLLGLEYQENYRVGYYLFSVMLASGLRYLFLLVNRGRGRQGQGKHPGGPIPYGQLLSYAWPLTIVSVAGIFNALSGPTLIKEWGFGGTTENLYWSGQFSAALKIAVLLNLFVTAYNYAAEPFFFRQAGRAGQPVDRKVYAEAARAYALVASLAVAGIMLFLPWVALIIDEGERQGLGILPILLFGNFFFGLFANFSVAYKLTDRTVYGGLIAGAGSLLLLAIAGPLIATYGIYAPAWGMLGCYALMSVLTYALGRRVFPVDYPLGRLTWYLFVALFATWLSTIATGMGVRIACFVALVVLLAVSEQKWLRATFLR